MNLGEYSSYDGVALANLVRRGETSPKELAGSFYGSRGKSESSNQCDN